MEDNRQSVLDRLFAGVFEALANERDPLLYRIFTLIRRRFGPDRQLPLVFAAFLIATVAGLIVLFLGPSIEQWLLS